MPWPRDRTWLETTRCCREREAREKAEELLRSLLTDRQWRSWQEHGCFRMRGQRWWRRYKVLNRRNQNVHRTFLGLSVASFCLVFEDDWRMPREDMVAAQVVMLRHDEAEFRAQAVRLIALT